MFENVLSDSSRKTFYKFLTLLAILLAYFGYLSWKFDLVTGGVVAGLTWSFFVLCTPVADAGFLLDFPIRLLFGFRMILTEILVWGIAIAINLACLSWGPALYEKTALTHIFHKILVTPWPYWSVIVLCGIGTFLSIHFGDEVMDAVGKKRAEMEHKTMIWRALTMIAIFGVIFWVYKSLIEQLGIESFF